MLIKPKLVQFDDGLYGVLVRRGIDLFAARFVDLTMIREDRAPTCWARGDLFFKDCKGAPSQARLALSYATRAPPKAAYGSYRVIKGDEA